MSIKKTVKLSHKTDKLSHHDLVKIIEKQSIAAKEQALKEKRLALRSPKKAQKDRKKPVAVLKQAYKIEKQNVKDEKKKKGVTMVNVIKEVILLAKEFVTLQSPVEVYIFVGSIWFTGVGVGYLLG